MMFPPAVAKFLNDHQRMVAERFVLVDSVELVQDGNRTVLVTTGIGPCRDGDECAGLSDEDAARLRRHLGIGDL